MKSKKLDLGCGKKKRFGSIGVDFNDRLAADVIHDLNIFPYPFKDSEFDEIYLDNTLEHLDKVFDVMEEVHRICKPEGIVKIIVPYFRSMWASIDPTHKHYFTVDSFAYFDPQNPICKRYDYTRAHFNVTKIIFNETLQNTYLKKLLLSVSNKWPRGYETYLSHLCPLDDITYYLKKC